MSFRTRLLVVALGTLALGIGALLILGNVLLGVETRRSTTDLLHARAEAQLAAVTVTSHGIAVRETPNDRVLDREAWVLEGGRVVERPAAVGPELDAVALALGRSAGRPEEREGPSDVRLRAEPIAAPGDQRRLGAVVVGTSVVATERLRHDVLIGSLVLAATVLLAAAFAIARALRAALRPVEQMTERAEDWGAHDLDRRFDLGPPRDELTGLAATLDHLLARIAASRRHEQRFAGDVAHELRTPVAALRGRAELALREDSGTSQELRASLRGVVAQAARLERTINALLAVARQEIDPAAGTADLAAIARSFDDVEVRAADGVPCAEGESEVVRRALAPLVENARRHGSRVRLELRALDGFVEVRVCDDGPGLDPALGEQAFEPGVQGEGSQGSGAGLGLALARRLARSCGGDVVVGDGPGGCFVLRLPRVSA